MNNIFKITRLGEIRQYTNQKGITSHCRDIQLQQLGGKFADRFTSTLFDAEAERELEVGALVAAQLYFYTTEYNDKGVPEREYFRNPDNQSKIIRLCRSK